MKKTIIILTLSLFLVFSAAAIGGGFMTYWQVTKKLEESPNDSTPSDVKVKASRDSTSIEISTALPGLIIFAFGSIGLFLLLIKIPIKEVIQSTSPDRGYGSEGIGPTDLHYPTPDIDGYNKIFHFKSNLYSKRMYRVPLPVWWLLKLSNIKVEKAIA